MTDNLAYELKSDVESLGSYNNSAVFTFKPTSCAADGACSMNSNTKEIDGVWYYTFYAATAERASYSSTGDVNGSICPAHWKMPYNYAYSSNKSLAKLLNSYGIGLSDHTSTTQYVIIESLPLSFARLGNTYHGDLYDFSTSGFSRSSTANSDARYSFDLLYTTSRVDPQHDRSKFYGEQVRCVAL